MILRIGLVFRVFLSRCKDHGSLAKQPFHLLTVRQGEGCQNPVSCFIAFSGTFHPAISLNIISFFIIMGSVVFNACAQLLVKAGTNSFGTIDLDRTKPVLSVFRIVSEPHILGGLACYVLSFAIWILALSRVSVSIAYPMVSIGYLITAIFAWYLFGESLSVNKLAGIGIIIVGVVLVAKS